MIAELWIEGAYIRGSVNDLSRQNIPSASQKEALFLWFRSSTGQSMGFLNPGLEVRILSESQHIRSIEVMANLPDCLLGTASSILAQTAKIHGNFSSDCLSEKNVEVNLQNWKDNGGCLPVLDAGGRKFESCFPDKMQMNS